MDIFDGCHETNKLLSAGKESEARDNLIKLLDFHKKNDVEYSPLVNHLIRQLGLYPYLQVETSDWQDRFAYESFKVDAGEDNLITLHREQSSILKQLVEGKDLAVSAPTSFGKSFIIDSFISIKKPKNIVIIVPTIALTDETRRRLHKKFSREYKVITTSDVSLAEKNILIFPQERAIHYVEKLETIDMLVIDEFYKASADFDKERSPSLINAIMKLGSKAIQRYFLAPNISNLKDSIFTKGMEFIHVDFNTVYLEKHNLYEEIDGDEDRKSDVLLDILADSDGKSLIYAGTYAAIDSVSNLLIDNQELSNSDKLKDFERWLIKNYDRNWHLTNLVKRGTGIHNGRLHRSLSQIQVRLFEEEYGLKNIVSTSSIIEGVNTSAENVIIWRNKNGRSKLNDFTYRNIIGRSGRMFKHFIGKVYILEKPPESAETQLSLELPEQLVGDIDLDSFKQELTDAQISKIIAYKDEMNDILGEDNFKALQKSGQLESSNSYLIKDIASDLSYNRDSWNGLVYLNSDNADDWERMLYKFIKLQPGGWGIEYSKFVGFIKVLADNWKKTIPELLAELDEYDIGVDKFFELERNVTFKLTSLLNDVNVLQKKIFDEPSDISSFISKASSAFLPPLVYQLEEYGLPRMVSRAVHRSGLINLEDEDCELHDVLTQFANLSMRQKLLLNQYFDHFDKYIFAYFIDGIRV